PKTHKGYSQKIAGSECRFLAMHGCVSPLSVVGRTPSPVDPEHARVRAGSAQASLWHQQITIKTERRFEQTRRDVAAVKAGGR
ncbi:MAG TPA: hypothetical protein VK652_02755, partial [Steroidobacteraceae bacterium]|nr:hypothetical protein [Steroidobacteraceae bacterium]